MLPFANACRMCNCHQTELLDQASKSVTPTLRTKKEKLLQETAENKPQTGVTFHWEETPARRNHTGKHHCWLPEGKLVIFTSDEGTGESRPSPCHTAPRPIMGSFNCFYTAGLGLKALCLWKVCLNTGNKQKYFRYWTEHSVPLKKRNQICISF